MRAFLLAAGFLLLLVLLVWSRLGGLDLSLWNDEAYSVVKYINLGPEQIFGGEYIPNNHVLFSWLAWRATQSLGQTESVYRLWSVVPAILAVVLASGFAAWRLGAPTALIFALLCTVSPVHLDLAPQARGYGLAFLAASMLLVGGARAAEHPGGVFAWLILATSGWLGIATLPVFVLPFLGEMAVLMARRRGRFEALLVLGGVSSGMLYFYRDLIQPILEARLQHFGEPLTVVGAAAAPFVHLLLPPSDPPSPWLTASSLIVGVTLTSLGVWRLLRLRAPRLLVSLGAPVATTYLGLWASGLYVVPRFTSYLLFHLLLLLALGLMEAIERLNAVVGARIVGLLTTATAIALLATFYRLALSAHALPIEAYKDVSALVRALTVERVVTNSLYSVGFDYYLPNQVEYPPPERLAVEVCEARQRLAYIEYPLRGPTADTTCLVGKAATRFTIPQRAGDRAGWMTVWVVEPGSGLLNPRRRRTPAAAATS